MMGLIIGLHALVCILLIAIILIQAGRGGGLVEGFSGVESMFGPKTNTLLIRTTTILAIFFFLTSVSIAVISARQSRSLMRSVKPNVQEEKTNPPEPLKPEAPRQELTPQTSSPTE